MTTHSLGQLIISFFRSYLAAQNGFSIHTIASYSDCIRLLLSFCCHQLHKTIDKLAMEEITDEIILDFLDHLETVRNNAPQTRNNRLAAIRTFFRFLALQEPELSEVCERVCAIRFKKTKKKVIEPLDNKEVVALNNAIDTSTVAGKRDYALMLLLYNTGARVQELVTLKCSNIWLEKPCFLKLMGKGKKERIVPLLDETVAAIKSYLDIREKVEPEHDSFLLNKHGKPITRFGILYIIKKYKKKAEKTCPSLRQKKVTPHTFRHTYALHMIQAGVDLISVKDTLGHADINTTSKYVTIDIEMKRKALEKSQIHTKSDKAKTLKWREPETLKFLENLSRQGYLCEAGHS
ncbi:tyrosine-type recombinase/integrase [candidate division CSSED10-310 bacterium]|uniref:Tyrosine-type recombinase/integrase n=1 Tax=candidate division CSSED10-310 bacterium TaxID=2855610 RepID=A0ABV6Z4M0_UNCC1